MVEKRSYEKTRIQTLALVAAVFIALMGTNILTSPANATVDIQARQKAGPSGITQMLQGAPMLNVNIFQRAQT